MEKQIAEETLRRANSALAWIKSLTSKLSAVRQPRKLKLVENLPLGEKRFLALVEVGGRQLLVGSTPTTISLIQRVDIAPNGLASDATPILFPPAC
jgi:flagellar biogenesis protein FliO